MKSLITILVIWVGLLAAGVVYTQAQEAVEGRPTKAWKLGVPGWVHTEIIVIDIAGVCIYKYDGYNKGGIAAVPKTQLPSGAGCQ